MLYADFIFKAKQETVRQLENGIWYLEPEWQDLICRNITAELDDLEDSYLCGWYDVEDILKLEVERRNAESSKKNQVIDWLYDLITAQVEPAMLQEETEYLKNFLEYKQATKT